MKNILVISDRHSVHARLRRALREDGWDVMDCPGPPVCASEGRCNLAGCADAIVLDTDLLGAMSGWNLYLRYASLDVPIAVLVPDEAVHAWIGDREKMLVMSCGVDPRELIRRLRDAIARAEARRDVAPVDVPVLATVGSA